MDSVIFQCDGTCMEPPSVLRAALMAGHLISISPESGSIPQRISRHICSVSTLHKPVKSWSCGACGPAWQQKTVVAIGACPIVIEVKFWPRTFQGLEARLVLFFIISCVVSIRKKKNLWSLDAEISSLEFLPHMESKTHSRKQCHCVCHPHTLGSDHRE